jgi:5-methylcytosine-specific restriction endonuclease McrA
MEDEEVTDKKGVYEYVLSGCSENIAKRLSKRQFSNADKRTMYERQNGICPHCGGHYEINEMVGDHIIPWWRGGKTTLDNLQMLCTKCNSGKAGKM